MKPIKYTETNYTFKEIRRANIDGTGPELLTNVSGVTPIATTLNIDTSKLIFGHNLGIDEIGVSGSLQKRIVQAIEKPIDIVIDPSGAAIYWTDSGSIGQTEGIYKAQIDGSNIQQLFSTLGQKPPHGIAYDTINNKIFWTAFDDTSGEINKVNIDGSDPQTLITNLKMPIDISLNPDSNEMFWTDQIKNTIEKSNRDGTAKNTVFENLNEPYGIAIFNQKLYWSEIGYPSIKRSNLDGSEMENVLSTGIRQPKFICLTEP